MFFQQINKKSDRKTYRSLNLPVLAKICILNLVHKSPFVIGAFLAKLFVFHRPDEFWLSFSNTLLLGYPSLIHFCLYH